MRWARLSLGVSFSLAGLAIVGLGVLYAMQPTAYRIARTVTIAAPRARVMAQLADLRAFEAWSPWLATPGRRPTVTFSASSTGVGAWVDRRDADGLGARTTLTSITDARVEMSNVTGGGTLGGGASMQTFTLREVPTGTEVTWTLESDLHGLARLLWPFVQLEARIGPEMEAALTRLDRASQ